MTNKDHDNEREIATEQDIRRLAARARLLAETAEGMRDCARRRRIIEQGAAACEALLLAVGPVEARRYVREVSEDDMVAVEILEGA